MFNDGLEGGPSLGGDAFGFAEQGIVKFQRSFHDMGYYMVLWVICQTSPFYRK